MRRVLMQYFEAFLLALVFAFIIRVFFVSAYRVTSEHMEPNLKVGDFIIASRWSSGWKPPLMESKIWKSEWPKRGDVVVVNCSKNSRRVCIKRLIALPGDRLEIIQGRLYLNGQVASYRSIDAAGGEGKAVELLAGDSRKIMARIGKNELEKIDRFGPKVIPPDHFFVLSDDRVNGVDSREWGELPKGALVAVVRIVWLSLDWKSPVFWGMAPSLRFERLFQGVD